MLDINYNSKFTINYICVFIFVFLFSCVSLTTLSKLFKKNEIPYQSKIVSTIEKVSSNIKKEKKELPTTKPTNIKAINDFKTTNYIEPTYIKPIYSIKPYVVPTIDPIIKQKKTEENIEKTIRPLITYKPEITYNPPIRTPSSSFTNSRTITPVITETPIETSIDIIIQTIIPSSEQTSN